MHYVVMSVLTFEVLMAERYELLSVKSGDVDGEITIAEKLRFLGVLVFHG